MLNNIIMDEKIIKILKFIEPFLNMKDEKNISKIVSRQEKNGNHYKILYNFDCIQSEEVILTIYANRVEGIIINKASKMKTAQHFFELNQLSTTVGDEQLDIYGLYMDSAFLKAFVLNQNLIFPEGLSEIDLETLSLNNIFCPKAYQLIKKQ